MKRLVAGALWFYAFWYLGSVVSSVLGIPDLLGPIVGVAAGMIVGLDPRHIIWRKPSAATQAAPA
jgi:putative effector of murein hydrolase LrgA (UPF0299 family)